MSIKHSLLAILTLGDCHGYQLRTELISRTSDSYNVNIGQVYATLERLERDGLVSASSANEDGQIRYRITQAGNAEAAAWLTSPVEHSAAQRDELAMKLALAVTLPGVDVDGILTTQRLASLQALQHLTTAKQQTDELNPTELAWILVIDSQIFAVEAQLRWLDHVAGLLNKAAARGLETQTEMQTNPAKRGRPSKANQK